MTVSSAIRTAFILSLLGAVAVAGQNAPEPALVEMENLRPHEVRVVTFTLPEAQQVVIEAIGADDRFPRSGPAGFIGRITGLDRNLFRNNDGWRGNAWILDAATRRVVWELKDSPTEDGRDGLRTFAGALQLPAGTYEAYYSSFTATRSEVTFSSIGNGNDQRRVRYDDDGFSRNLGFIIRGRGTAAQPAGVGAGFQRNTIVSLTSLRAGERRSAGFAISRPTQVEVYTIGEISGQPYDYGWIMNADTRERIWVLSEDESEHAGGAAKNRMLRATMTLPPGRYVATYALDGSHDATSWNAAPPRDPAFWGLTLRVVNPADRRNVRPFTYEAIPSNAVVSLNRVRDNESRSEGFTVTRAVDVMVLALGEGTARAMDDYGWILDARTRQRVWTMAFEGSEHAGGSERNRIVRHRLRLQPGSYIANFRTDGGHAWGDWSGSDPVDGELWGMTILPVDPADRSAFRDFDADAAQADVIVRLVGMTDGEDARATFTLDEPANVRIYALGEGSGNSMYDYGWIEDRATRQVVWEMTYRLTTHAGGSSKNRLFNGVVHLPAGSYVLRYRSDDSHSSERWNDDMPDDPQSYGITIYRQ